MSATNPLPVEIDLREAAKTLGRQEARYLVSTYYRLQRDRIRSGNQVGALERVGKPHVVLSYLTARTQENEDEVGSALDSYSAAQRPGRWARRITGIGHVIAAGMLAHVDPELTTATSKLWRLAGLDPTNVWLSKDDAEALAVRHVAKLGLPTKRTEITMELCASIGAEIFRRADRVWLLAREWKDGQPTEIRTMASLIAGLARRPWSAQLRVLCWKAGESFKMLARKGRPQDLYGTLYLERKAIEVQRNEGGAFAELAASELKTRRFAAGPTRDAYKAGQLPAGRLDLRATRYATKVFLSHFLYVSQVCAGQTPTKPWIVTYGGHKQEIPVPLWPCE